MVKKLLSPLKCGFNVSPEFRINVDCRPAAKELLNYAGWPMNEISLLMKLNMNGDGDSALANSIMAGLIELPSPVVDNSGKSNRDLLDMVIPRYIGTLGEYLKYLDTLPLNANERALLEKRAKDTFSDDDSSDAGLDTASSDTSVSDS